MMGRPHLQLFSSSECSQCFFRPFTALNEELKMKLEKRRASQEWLDSWGAAPCRSVLNLRCQTLSHRSYVLILCLLGGRQGTPNNATFSACIILFTNCLRAKKKVQWQLTIFLQNTILKNSEPMRLAAKTYWRSTDTYQTTNWAWCFPDSVLTCWCYCCTWDT